MASDPVKDYLFGTFGPKYNFSHFFASLCSAYYFCNILPIFIVHVQKCFQPPFAQHIIFELIQKSNLLVLVPHI